MPLRLGFFMSGIISLFIRRSKHNNHPHCFCVSRDAPFPSPPDTSRASVLLKSSRLSPATNRRPLTDGDRLQQRPENRQVENSGVRFTAFERGNGELFRAGASQARATSFSATRRSGARRDKLPSPLGEAFVRSATLLHGDLRVEFVDRVARVGVRATGPERHRGRIGSFVRRYETLRLHAGPMPGSAGPIGRHLLCTAQLTSQPA